MGVGTADGVQLANRNLINQLSNVSPSYTEGLKEESVRLYSSKSVVDSWK